MLWDGYGAQSDFRHQALFPSHPVEIKSSHNYLASRSSICSLKGPCVCRGNNMGDLVAQARWEFCAFQKHPAHHSGRSSSSSPPPPPMQFLLLQTAPWRSFYCVPNMIFTIEPMGVLWGGAKTVCGQQGWCQDTPRPRSCGGAQCSLSLPMCLPAAHLLACEARTTPTPICRCRPVPLGKECLGGEWL